MMTHYALILAACRCARRWRAALAQAPAPAAKPTIPQVCRQLPQAAAEQLRRASSRTSRSSAQADPAQDRRAHGNSALRPQDDQGGGRRRWSSPPKRCATSPSTARRASTTSTRTARSSRRRSRSRARSRSRRKNSRTTRKSSEAGRAGPGQGHYTLIDSRPLPRLQEGTIPTAINLPYPAFDKFLDRLPQGQDRADRVLLPGRHLHDEPQFAAAAPRRWATPTSRSTARAMPEWIEKNIGVHRRAVPQGRVDRQGHPARAGRCAAG